MRLRNIFHRKNIAAFGLLVVILLSINKPILDFPTLFGRELNLNKATQYLCIAADLPPVEDAKFFGNPFDPASNSNTTALYYRAQFFLAPRLLHLISTLDNQFGQDEIQWFIGSNLDAEQAAQISTQYPLKLINNCGALHLFQKN